MRLCDIPWEDLQIGDIVINNNNIRGEVTKLIVKNKNTGRYKDNSIVISWFMKNRNVKRETENYHCYTDFIEYDKLANLCLRCCQE